MTALFCDLVGFTPLSERLDAEQIRNLQTAYFERMSREIERFGGAVEKFAGDAVLALFGIPVAHGDDAERAVLCGLKMQEAMVALSADAASQWGAELALRVGVNTGEAVSGLVEAGGRKDYSVTGDVVNTAARLQTAADPGSIMVGEETMRLTRKRVRFGERRELTLKGKGRAVAAYQVLERREPRMQRAEGRRDIPAIVGREHELGIVVQAWERAQQSEGRLVTVVADAGIGKSRLLAEAVQQIGSEGQTREVWGRCLSYGQDVSLSLVADLLRSIVGAREQDDSVWIRSGLSEAIGALLASQDDETRSAAVDVLGEMLGLPPSGSAVSGAGAQVRRQTLVKSLRLLISGLSQELPTVLVLEDLHWVDAASAEVLSEALENIPSLRLLVLASHRPGWTAPWAEWSWVERLNLRPLNERDAAALAIEVLGAPLTAELKDYIADRAGGNPFFVEELLHVLHETGGIVEHDGQMHLVSAAAERLPATLTEILLARLDGLEEDVRNLVQVASVIGRDFGLDLLARVTNYPEGLLEPSLATLVRAEIAFPMPGGRTEYSFKHVTMRDVAYNTLLLRRRQELHAATARAMTALYGTDESAEIIAYHYAQTDEHASAAHWMERAGDRSADMYANQSAMGHYEEARRRLELSGSDPADLARVGEKLGGVFRLMAWYDEAIEELEGAAEVYRASGDVEGEARTTAHIGQVHFLRGASEEAISRVRDFLRRLDLDDEAEPSPGLTELYTSLVDPLYNLNRFEDALTVAWRAVELARELNDDRLLVESSVRYGLALQGIGRLDEARQVLEDILPAAEAVGDVASVAKALVWLGDIALAQGYPLAGKAYYERAISVDEDRGDLAETASLLGRLGNVASILGHWDQAREYYERTVDLVRSISFAHFSASALMTLGEHYLRQGAADEASRYLEEPFTIAERSGQVARIPYLRIPLAAWDVFEGRPETALERLAALLAEPHFETPLDHQAMQIAAESLVQLGDEPAAEAIVSEGLGFAQGQTNRLALLGWLQVQSDLFGARQRWQEAEEILEQALSEAQEMPNPFEEARILHRQGLLHQRQGREGRALFEAACEVFLRLGARPYAERVQADLEERAAV